MCDKHLSEKKTMHLCAPFLRVWNSIKRVSLSIIPPLRDILGSVNTPLIGECGWADSLARPRQGYAWVRPFAERCTSLDEYENLTEQDQCCRQLLLGHWTNRQTVRLNVMNIKNLNIMNFKNFSWTHKQLDCLWYMDLRSPTLCVLS